MFVPAKSTIAGRPALEVRAFLRAAAGDGWGIEFARRRLHLPLEVAREVVAALEREGYIEPDAREPGTWGRTLKGGQLANASAAKALHRRTAERKLQELLARVDEVNGSDDFLYRVVRVGVFGSYLSGAERLNDLDIAIQPARKERDGERWTDRCEAHAQKAEEAGRYFGSFFDRFCWPARQVTLFLRSPRVSIHPFKDVLGPVSIVFETPDAATRDDSGDFA